MRNLSDLYGSLKNEGKKNFLVKDDTAVSYQTLRERVDSFSALFRSHSIECGDRIVICSADEEFVISAVVSAFFNGVTVVLLSPDTAPSRALSLILKSEPALVFLDEKLNVAWDLAESIPCFPVAVRSGGSALLSRFRRGKTKHWSSDVAQFGSQKPIFPLSDDSISFINFTSGTTGNPKGVQLTVKNILCHMETLKSVFHYDANSRILNNMILAHADGMLQGPILALYCGCTLYRPLSMDIQDLEGVLNTIYREKITHMLTVPTVLSFIDRLAQYDDYFTGKEFKHLISVAGMLDVNVWTRLEQRLSARISNIYGLTETVAGGLFCGPEESSFRHGTIGIPVDIETRVVDEHGIDVECGNTGELYLKGDCVFPGYFRAQAETDAVFTDGWFHTGDLATQDNDGFIQISGRKKELIISGGFNIHPAEVNEALLLHPAVAEVATLGLPDSEWQEVVASAVVKKSEEAADEQSLIDYCRLHLDPKKVPKKILFMDTLPRGDAGKVKIPELRAFICGSSTNSSTSSGDIDENAVLSMAADIFQVGRQTLTLQSKAGETPGWDSLGHMGLVVAFEKATDRTLTPQEIMSVKSLSDLLKI